MLKLAFASLVLILMAACSSVEVEDYRSKKPTLAPEEFFAGYLTAHGVVKNRGGLVVRMFTAEIDASWSDGVGTLVEDFIFDDGEEQRRIWTLTPDGEGGYAATAGDVVGPGVAKVAGNSMFLDYVLRIPYGDSTVDVRVDDRMYLISPDVLINESSLKKFGFRVGSIDLVIVRHPDGRPLSS